jgi:putative transposase
VTAPRYVALNPVRARLVERAEDWPWSSTRAHIAGADDHVVKVAPSLERVGDFAAFLAEPFDEALSYAALRKAESVGRPVGSTEWLADMKARTGLALRSRKRGPKPRAGSGATTFLAIALQRGARVRIVIRPRWRWDWRSVRNNDLLAPVAVRARRATS